MRDPEEVREWLRKAEEDFAGAVDLSRRRKTPLPDLICFHRQQAVEKYLKAFLIFHEEGFPKTHDLMMLLTLSTNYEPQLELHRELFEFLNPYSVQFRYPGEHSRLEESAFALKAVKKIRKIFFQLFPSELLQKLI